MPRRSRVRPGARVSRPLRGTLGALVTVLAAVAVALATASVRPAAAADPAPATVVLDAATTSTLRPDTPLVLAGTVTGTGSDELRDVQVILRTSSSPLESAAEVAAVDDDETFRTGRRDVRHFEEVTRLLEPGATAPFRLEVPAADLGFRAQGVYVVGLDVTATLPDRSRTTVAQVRTVVPRVVDTLPAVPVALLWSLTDRPALLPDGRLADDGLAGALAAGGRLGRLVATGAGTPVTWFVDQDLVTTALTMSDGYEVRAADGSSTSGTGTPAASAWLAGLGGALAGRSDVGALPVADADLVAALRSQGAGTGAVPDVVDAAVAPAESLATTLARLPDGTGGRGAVVASGLLAPIGGVLDADTAGAMAAAGARRLVLRADALDPVPDGPRATVPVGSASGAGSVEVVTTDPVLDGTLGLAGTDGAEVRARQRLLAATAMHAMSAADAGTVPAPVLAQAPHGWSPTAAGLDAIVGAWTGTPWVTAAGLDDALATAPAATPARLDYDEGDRSAELSAEQLGAVDAAGAELQRIATVLVDPREAVAAGSAALLRGLSAAWRQDGPGGRAYLDAVTAEADRGLAAIRVDVPAELTLSGRTGRFPVSISNGLDQAVRVGLAFSSANPDRLTVADVAPQVVEAGETAQVLVEAQARANGRVGVGVRPVAPDGGAIADMQSFVVVATNFDTIGWVVVGGAVLVLVTGSAIRLVQRARRARDVRRAGRTAQRVLAPPRERQAVP